MASPVIGGLVAALVLLFAASPLSAQPTIQYAYDALGRLIAVVDQNGNAGVYNYDAVGNLLSIERVDGSVVPGAVGITLVLPAKGKVGTTVQIFGKGFSATGAGTRRGRGLDRTGQLVRRGRWRRG